MGKEQQPISRPQENFYENPFFLVQVKYHDGKGGRGVVRELPSPFPPEYTEEELLQWMNEQDAKFQENLGKGTLDKL